MFLLHRLSLESLSPSTFCPDTPDLAPSLSCSSPGWPIAVPPAALILDPARFSPPPVISDGPVRRPGNRATLHPFLRG